MRGNLTLAQRVGHVISQQILLIMYTRILNEILSYGKTTTTCILFENLFIIHRLKHTHHIIKSKHKLLIKYTRHSDDTIQILTHEQQNIHHQI